MGQIKRRTDNIPAKLTAHAVRRLTMCAVCGGLGDKALMIHGDTHTSCFVERFGFERTYALPAAECAKLRLCDISKLTSPQCRKIFDKGAAA
jgi:hypothetical protein